MRQSRAGLPSGLHSFAHVIDRLPAPASQRSRSMAASSSRPACPDRERPSAPPLWSAQPLMVHRPTARSLRPGVRRSVSARRAQHSGYSRFFSAVSSYSARSPAVPIDCGCAVDACTFGVAFVSLNVASSSPATRQPVNNIVLCAGAGGAVCVRPSCACGAAVSKQTAEIREMVRISRPPRPAHPGSRLCRGESMHEASRGNQLFRRVTARGGNSWRDRSAESECSRRTTEPLRRSFPRAAHTSLPASRGGCAPAAGRGKSCRYSA